MKVTRLEPEAVSLGSEGRDVELEGNVNGVDGEGSLQHRARFLSRSTLSAEDDDSSIVSLHARFAELLFRLCGLHRRFGAERFVRVCCTDTGARRQTARLGGN